MCGCMCESGGGYACNYAKLRITSGGRVASEAKKSRSVALALKPLAH